MDTNYDDILPGGCFHRVTDGLHKVATAHGNVLGVGATRLDAIARAKRRIDDGLEPEHVRVLLTESSLLRSLDAKIKRVHTPFDGGHQHEVITDAVGRLQAFWDERHNDAGPSHGYDLRSEPPTTDGYHWALRADDQGAQSGKWVMVHVVGDTATWLGSRKLVTDRRFIQWDHHVVMPPR